MTTSFVVQRSFSHQIHQLPLTIFLKGELPPHLLDTTIPLQLSLSLPEPYNLYLQPMTNEEAAHVQNLAVGNLSGSAPTSTTVPLPTFLPLPPTFDHYRTESWVELHKSIAGWMSTFIERKNNSQQNWEWGREAYWMAFAAAYTNFPNRNWPSWDTTIELEGPFIRGWFYGERKRDSPDDEMDDSEDSSEDSENGSEDSEDSKHSDMDTRGREREIREDVWQRFRMHVWAGYSILI